MQEVVTSSLVLGRSMAPAFRTKEKAIQGGGPGKKAPGATKELRRVRSGKEILARNSRAPRTSHCK